MKQKHEVSVCNVSAERIPAHRIFRVAALTALQSTKNSVLLSIRIVDEQESADLNQYYREKTGSTNVLAFPMNVFLPDQTLLLGDVVICAPVVKREAKIQRKSLASYFSHMVIHGSLHLLGFDHQTDKEARVMEALEKKYLNQMLNEF
jgi:probable rRNA maturation factor